MEYKLTDAVMVSWYEYLLQNFQIARNKTKCNYLSTFVPTYS